MKQYILIIDDDSNQVVPMRDSLRTLCEDVHVAYSYEEGLELINGEFFYALIVCDVNLGHPSKDGYSLGKVTYSKLQGRSHWLFISGSPEETKLVSGLENSSFLLKGGAPEELLGIAKNILLTAERNAKRQKEVEASFTSFEERLKVLESSCVNITGFGKGLATLRNDLEARIVGLEKEIQEFKKTEILLDQRVTESTAPSWSLFGAWVKFFLANKILYFIMVALLGAYKLSTIGF